MFEAITAHIPALFAQSKSNDDSQQAMTDPQGRTRGLEDPLNPALIDDPAIFSSDIPVVPASAVRAGESSKNLIDGTGQPFINPALYGGSNVNMSTATLGEPLNVIISAKSSPAILTAKGLQNFLRSLDLDFECLGLHSGGPQRAWLDPRGWVNEQFLYRQVFTPLDHIFGTCIESLRGGNHIRAWQQMGTGAWFLAASKEEDVLEHHMIIPDGYNIGRDFLVQKIEESPTNQTSFMFKNYQTKIEYITGLIPAGTQGINHNISQDGKVALLTVKLLSSREKSILDTKRKQAKPSSIPVMPMMPKRKRFSLPLKSRRNVVAAV